MAVLLPAGLPGVGSRSPCGRRPLPPLPCGRRQAPPVRRPVPTRRTVLRIAMLRPTTWHSPTICGATNNRLESQRAAACGSSCRRSSLAGSPRRGCAAGMAELSCGGDHERVQLVGAAKVTPSQQPTMGNGASVIARARLGGMTEIRVALGHRAPVRRLRERQWSPRR